MRSILLLLALCGVARAEPRVHIEAAVDGRARLEVTILDIAHEAIVMAADEGRAIAQLEDARTFAPTAIRSFARGPDSIAIVVVGAALSKRDIALLPEKHRVTRMPSVERAVAALERATEMIRVLIAVDGPKLNAALRKRTAKMNIRYVTVPANEPRALRHAVVTATRRTYLTFRSSALPWNGKEHEITIRIGDHTFEPFLVTLPQVPRAKR